MPVLTIQKKTQNEIDQNKAIKISFRYLYDDAEAIRII